MGVALTVAAALLAALVIAAGVLSGSLALVLIGLAAPLLGVVVLVLLAWAMRDRFRAWASRGLVAVAGPAIVRSMPPREVLRALLNRVFGESVSHEEISSALLGGGGHDVSGFDVAVSRSTTVEMCLQRIAHGSCLTEMTWTYEFAGVRDNHRLVMFTTTSEDIFRLLPSRRVYPLFESWLVSTDDQLDDYVPGFRSRLEAGITYRDEDGFVHTVEPSASRGDEVELREFGQFVRLPERDRKQLRIVHLDLYDLAHPDHVVEAVERVTLRASTIGPFDEGFVAWSAPYPCFVDAVTYDVRELARPHEKIEYQVLLNTNGMLSVPFQSGWTHVPDVIEVPVHAWMLPGHGVTLLWRPVDGTESLGGAEQY